MKLFFFTRHQNLGASSRYRSLQYFDHLISQGYEVKHHYFFSDNYLRKRYSGNWPLLSIFYRYLSRLFSVLFAAKDADIIFIEKELFPFLPAFTENFLMRGNAKVIYDYDDAIWHSYEKLNYDPFGVLSKKISKVVCNSDATIAGSSYLAQGLSEMGADFVIKIPTCVSEKKYRGQGLYEKKTTDIVWIGSMSTAAHVKTLFPVFDRLHRERGSVARLIGFPEGFLDANTPPFVEIFSWSKDTELQLLASSRVGIMPLPDEKFERGKCGFKLIQYMGIGLPTIASPVGENNYIIDNGVTGFFATSNDEWYLKIKKILDSDLEKKMSLAGYERYKSFYSTCSAEKKLEQLIISIKK